MTTEKSLFDKLQRGEFHLLDSEEKTLYYRLRDEAVTLMKTFPSNEVQYVADAMLKFYLLKREGY